MMMIMMMMMMMLMMMMMMLQRTGSKAVRCKMKAMIMDMCISPTRTQCYLMFGHVVGVGAGKLRGLPVLLLLILLLLILLLLLLLYYTLMYLVYSNMI